MEEKAFVISKINWKEDLHFYQMLSKVTLY